MILRFISYMKSDYNRRTFIFSLISMIVCFAFAIFNGVLGIIKQSIWCGSICIYYLLLLSIKMLLLLNRNKKGNEIGLTIVSYSILLIITLAMITPAILMIRNERTYSFGLIPAISSAAYTTYSFTLAIINLTKASKSDNLIVRQLRLINMITALMSIIVLQNTLISANGGYDESMKLLTTYTSFLIIGIAVILIVIYLIKTLKKKNDPIEE